MSDARHPRRRVPTAASRAKAERIAAALEGLLEDLPPPEPPRASEGDPYRAGEGPPPRPRPKADLRCPGCGGPMWLAYRRGVEIHRCQGCEGLWLDPGELDAMVEPPLEERPDVARLRREMAGVAPPSEVRYRKCPRCAAVMNRRNFGTSSGVILDECREHGIFLDPGEFEAIEKFVTLGGMALHQQDVEQRLRQRQQRAEEAERTARAAAQNPHVGTMGRRLWWNLFDGLISW